MAVTIGDSVPQDCQAVDNIPVSALANTAGTLARSGELSGRLMLAADQSEYEQVFTDNDLSICQIADRPFSSSGNVLFLNVKQKPDEEPDPEELVLRHSEGIHFSDQSFVIYGPEGFDVPQEDWAWYKFKACRFNPIFNQWEIQSGGRILERQNVPDFHVVLMPKSDIPQSVTEEEVAKFEHIPEGVIYPHNSGTIIWRVEIGGSAPQIDDPPCPPE